MSTPNNVINMAHLFQKKTKPSDRVLGYIPIPKGLIIERAKKCDIIGDYSYLIQIVKPNGKAYDLMNTAFSERKSGSTKNGPVYESMLLRAIRKNSKDIRSFVKTQDDVFVKRDGHISLLAVKCAHGIIIGAIYYGKRANSTNGLHMLEFVMYLLGVANLDHDSSLLKVALHSLADTEGLPPFDKKGTDEEAGVYLSSRARSLLNPK